MVIRFGRSLTRLAFFSLLFRLLSLVVRVIAGPKRRMPSIFTFAADTIPTGFTSSEIDTVTIFRLEANTQYKIDSVVTNDQYIFFDESSGYFPDKRFWNYDYVVQPQTTANFNITDIEIEGEERGSWCRCYHNTKKKFKVNGQEYDFSGNSPAYNNRVVLTK